MNYLREREALVITRLDRFTRSTVDLCNIAAELEKKKVAPQVIDQNIDINDATGRLLFNMLRAISQFEIEIRADRQIEGINKALGTGVKFDREFLLKTEEITELRKKREEGAAIDFLM
jgi:DNA invertase Pin-like site-specific DNA recombinase